MPGAKQKKPACRREPVTVALALGANRWIRAEAQARGWRLVHLWYSEFELPPGIVPRGALVQNLPDDPHVLKLLDQGCAVVRLGKLPHPDDDKVPAVLPDHVAEGALAAEHFFEREFQHVGYFGRDPWSDVQACFEGFRDRAETLGMACHLYRARSIRKGEAREVSKARIRREFAAWLQEVPQPLGLLASGAYHAAMNCSWAIHAGFRVPDDVAVLSPSNRADICASSMPMLSSLDLDDAGRVHAACELLDRLMSGASAPTAPILVPPAGVVERESTHVLATPDRTVAAALRYMWDRLDVDLSVEDVAREVGMSSRQLGRHFQRALKRTVTEEMCRKRLEEAKRLLRTTKLAVGDVAPRVGFRSATYFHRSFRQAFGMTPTAYRRARGGG